MMTSPDTFKNFLVQWTKTNQYVFENPDGSVSVGLRTTTQQAKGGAPYRKTSIKKRIEGRERVIYLGKNNKQYIKRNGAYVAVHA